MPIDIACFKGNLDRVETGTQLQEFGIIITILIYLALPGVQFFFIFSSKYPKYNWSFSSLTLNYPGSVLP